MATEIWSDDLLFGRLHAPIFPCLPSAFAGEVVQLTQTLWFGKFMSPEDRLLMAQIYTNLANCHWTRWVFLNIPTNFEKIRDSNMSCQFQVTFQCIGLSQKTPEVPGLRWWTQLNGAPFVEGFNLLSCCFAFKPCTESCCLSCSLVIWLLTFRIIDFSRIHAEIWWQRFNKTGLP